GVPNGALLFYIYPGSFNVTLFALLILRSRTEIFLVCFSVPFNGCARRFFMSGKEGADHNHACAKAYGLGNISMSANAAVCNNGFAGCFGAPAESRKLPAAGTES